MRLIIAGGRDYQFTEEDKAWLDAIHAKYKVTMVISGGARGADYCGEAWAAANGILVLVKPAEWNVHGKAAGPIRNEEMAREATAVALFSGGKGTASMRSIAKRYGLQMFEREVK